MYIANLDDAEEDQLRQLAQHEHRSFRDQGRHLLILKIREDYARLLQALEPVAEVA